MLQTRTTSALVFKNFFTQDIVVLVKLTSSVNFHAKNRVKTTEAVKYNNSFKKFF